MTAATNLLSLEAVGDAIGDRRIARGLGRIFGDGHVAVGGRAGLVAAGDDNERGGKARADGQGAHRKFLSESDKKGVATPINDGPPDCFLSQPRLTITCWTRRVLGST